MNSFAETIDPVHSSDGATFEMRSYRQVDNPAAPVIICMPAMGCRGDLYVPLAQALQRDGFQVVIGELRGQGSSSVRSARGVRYGYHEMVVLDYPALFRAVAVAFPKAERYLLGHSLGGQLGSLYLGYEPRMASGLILVGAPSCHYRSWSGFRSIGILIGVHIALLVALLVGYFPGRRLGVLGDNSAQLIRDFSAQVRSGLYRVPSSEIDFESMLQAVDIPILAVTVEGDHFAPGRGIQRLCAKMENARTTHWRLIPEGVGRRNPHYSWIRHNSTLIEQVRRFIGSND